MAGRTIRSWAVNGWTRDYWLFSLVGRENEVPCRVRNRIEVISGMSHEGFKAFVVRARFTWPVGKSKFRFYRTTGEKAREPLCSRRGLELIAILESNSEVVFFSGSNRNFMLNSVLFPFSASETFVVWMRLWKCKLLSIQFWLHLTGIGSGCRTMPC